MAKTSSELLKFCSPTAHAIQNLENGQIFCQHFSAYNDPFEFWAEILTGIPNPDREPERYLAAIQTWGFQCASIDEAMTDDLIQGSVRDYFEECQDYAPSFETMRQGTRIACFGSERNNLLMWSHYADGLRGFCIVFDEDDLVTNDTDYIFEVSYVDAPPVVDSFLYGIAKDQDWYSGIAIEETEAAIRHQGRSELQGEIAMYGESGAAALQTMRKIWQQVFATKPTAWKYERERRLLLQTNRTDIKPIGKRYYQGQLEK